MDRGPCRSGHQLTSCPRSADRDASERAHPNVEAPHLPRARSARLACLRLGGLGTPDVVDERLVAPGEYLGEGLTRREQRGVEPATGRGCVSSSAGPGRCRRVWTSAGARPFGPVVSARPGEPRRTHSVGRAGSPGRSVHIGAVPRGRRGWLSPSTRSGPGLPRSGVRSFAAAVEGAAARGLGISRRSTGCVRSRCWRCSCTTRVSRGRWAVTWGSTRSSC
jgi:hypothetical protein